MKPTKSAKFQFAVYPEMVEKAQKISILRGMKVQEWLCSVISSAIDAEDEQKIKAFTALSNSLGRVEAAKITGVQLRSIPDELKDAVERVSHLTKLLEASAPHIPATQVEQSQIVDAYKAATEMDYDADWESKIQDEPEPSPSVIKESFIGSEAHKKSQQAILDFAAANRRKLEEHLSGITNNPQPESKTE